MANSDTAAAKKYASIAEVAAAQAQLYYNEMGNASEYAGQAQEYAEQAQSSADTSSQLLTQVQSLTTIASSAQESASQSSSSAQSSASDAASSAESAGAAAQEKVDGFSEQLASSDTGLGNNLVKHALLSSLGDSITIYTYVDRYISLEAFYLSSDNGDYGPAVTRAFAYSSANGVAIRVDKKHLIKTQPTMSSNSTFVGLGRLTGLYCADDTPVVMLYGNGLSNITIENMSFNGGVTSSTSSSNSTRGARFLYCDSVILNNVFAERIADWGMSFEFCTNSRVTKYTYSGGGFATPGGRDGLHFYNPIGVTIDDCDIESGDDCIGITVGASFAASNIRISNVRGKSDIASVVTIGFETDLSGTIDNLKIDDVYCKSIGGARYIVQCRGTSANSITNASISRIYGTSYLYGMYLQYIDKLVLNDINIVSQTQHGLYATACGRISGRDLRASSIAATYDGMQFANCTGRIVLENAASASGPVYSAQFNACTEVITKDADFTEGASASLRAVNNTRVTFHGNATTTIGAYGINQAGNTYFKAEPGSQVSGVTAAYNTIPNNGVSDNAYAYGDVTQDSATTISAASVYTNNVTITASATGQVDFVIPRGMRTNRYMVDIHPYGTSFRNYRIGPKTNAAGGGFSVFFTDSTGAAVNGQFTFKIYESGTINV